MAASPKLSGARPSSRARPAPAPPPDDAALQAQLHAVRYGGPQARTELLPRSPVSVVAELPVEAARPGSHQAGGTPDRQTNWTSERRALIKSAGVAAKSFMKDAITVEREQMERAARLFGDLDDDHSGTLGRSELAKLARKLNHRWSALDLSHHFERLASMERKYRRSVHDDAGLGDGFVPEISAAVSRAQLGVAGGRGTASLDHQAPWYVLVPRLARLGVSVASQQLRKDYAHVDLNAVKDQAKVWGVDDQKLEELEELEKREGDTRAVEASEAVKENVIGLIAEVHASKQLFNISFLEPFDKDRFPADREARPDGSLPLTSREAQLIWARYQSRFDPNEKEVTEIQHPVFVTWWKGYRRRMHREMLMTARKYFLQSHSHVVDFTAGHTHGSEEFVRVMSPDEMKSLGRRIVRDFDWLKADIGSMFDDHDFETARACQVCMVDGALTFDEFAHYVRRKIGSDEASTKILPEYMVQQIDEHVPTTLQFSVPASKELKLQRQKSYQKMLSAKAQLQAARDKAKDHNTYENRRAVASALWRFLRPRLEMLVRFETVWGSLHELYPQKSESAHVEDFVPPNIRHPDSRRSIVWDLLQVFALIYVAVFVPLRICFDYEPRPPSADGLGDVGWWADLVMDLYFFADIFVMFHTAFVDTDTGRLITDRKVISQTYMRSWFCIDVVSVMPFSYIQLLQSSGFGGALPVVSSHNSASLNTVEVGGGSALAGNTKIFKLLRFLRIAKLLRLTKFKAMMMRYEDKFDVSQYVRTTAILVIITGSAHFVTCLWYTVGTGQTDTINGWVTNPDTGLRWEMQDEVTLGTRYIASVHGIMSGQWAFTNSEKLFSVIAELIIGLIYGALAGLMSSIMMSASSSEQEKTLKFLSIRAWMKSRDLPRTMQAKIMSHYHSKYKLRAVFDEQLVRYCVI